MYALDNKSGIEQMPEIPEVFSKNPLWFTEGRDGNAPSYPGAHWFNIVQAELLNVLKEAGIEPEKADLTQLAQAFRVMAGQVDSIAALREFEPVRDRQMVYVKGYYANSTKGGGYFVTDLSDTASADNGGTVIVTNGGARWKKVGNTFNPYDFGWQKNFYPNGNALKNEIWEKDNLAPLPSYSYLSRQLLVSDANSGKLDWLADGIVVIAENALYIRKYGAKTIPDLPNWDVIPKFEHFGNYISGYDATVKTHTTIKYHNWHDVSINVIEIKNPKLRSLQKLFLSDVNNTLVQLKTPREFFKSTGHRILINCDGWRLPEDAQSQASDYGKPIGLQIVNGRLYQDWLPSESKSEAVVMLKTGKLVAARKGDGISGQQWIEKGALWSATFAGFVLEEGRVRANDSTQKSARTVLGQKPDGTLIIFCADGRTDQFGLTIQECGEFALSLGATIAYCLDGGGSTQLWWQDCYATHSSDGGFRKERKVPSLLVIDSEPLPPFDTGWHNLALANDVKAQSDIGVRWRQYGSQMRVDIAVEYPFSGNVDKEITLNNLPQSKIAGNFNRMKTVAIGERGGLGGVYTGKVLSARATGSTSYLVGRMVWDSMNSEL